MKVVTHISKTFQEESYEPIRIELTVERNSATELKDKEIVRMYKDDAIMLQETIDEIFIERRREIEAVNMTRGRRK